MTGIVEFLTARLDEDQATAVAARDKHAGRYPAENDAEWRHTVPGSNGVYTESRSNAVVIGSYEHPLDDETANHIARHDPARALREVAAKRKLIETYVETCAARKYALEDDETDESERRALAASEAALHYALCVAVLPYADHVDYESVSFATDVVMVEGLL